LKKAHLQFWKKAHLSVIFTAGLNALAQRPENGTTPSLEIVTMSVIVTSQEKKVLPNQCCTLRKVAV
jgi:hypothetical protein